MWNSSRALLFRAAGLLVVLMLIAKFFCSSNASQQLILPNRVERAIASAIDEGVLSKDEVIELNDWLNAAVRTKPIRLSFESVEFSTAVPNDALARLGRGEECDQAEAMHILAWLAQLHDAEIPSEIRMAMVQICITKKADARSKRMIAKWLQTRLSRNERMDRGGRQPVYFPRQFPSAISRETEPIAAPEAAPAAPAPEAAPAPAPAPAP